MVRDGLLDLITPLCNGELVRLIDRWHQGRAIDHTLLSLLDMLEQLRDVLRQSFRIHRLIASPAGQISQLMHTTHQALTVNDHHLLKTRRELFKELEGLVKSGHCGAVTCVEGSEDDRNSLANAHWMKAFTAHASAALPAALSPAYQGQRASASAHRPT